MTHRLSYWRYVATAARMAFDAFREGRLTASPARWLVDLRHLLRQMQTPGSSVQPDASAETERTVLARFLRDGDTLDIEEARSPVVSVLLVLHNRAELTLRCLTALAAHGTIPLELVIVDNGSSDETSKLLERVRGARVIRSTDNLGFLRGCNRAAEAARGEYLLFLNNDTELQPDSLASALETITGADSVGAVGGRLVFPDGRLQEAGSIIWNDGSCLGYGRGDQPWAPQYSFVRDVDFCSAAFLLTPRQLFLELGKFDDRYQPAYYEDVDYCVRLWKAGKRVVYDPRAVVTHVEFGSSGSAGAAVAMQLARRATFVEAHRDWLRQQRAASSEAVLWARDRRQGLRVLVVDDRVPRAALGFGFPRSVALVSALAHLGHAVSLLPAWVAEDDWEHAYDEVPRNVEVLVGDGPGRIADLFRERRDYYDIVIVSRSHNMELLLANLGAPAEWTQHARVIYDAEALTAGREIERRQLSREVVAEHERQRLLAEELALTSGVDAVLAVSPEEYRQFDSVMPGRVHLVSHAVAPVPTVTSFAARRGILFAGAFHELSPNADAVLWYAEHVLPIVRTRLGDDVALTIVGPDPPASLTTPHRAGVRVTGGVPDLVSFYDAARIFVAPTRYAAGIPLKVLHAAAHGVPVIATSLLARQLDWRDGTDLLVADDPEAFADACVKLYTDESLWKVLRANALTKVADVYSPRTFTAAVERALTAARAFDRSDRLATRAS